MLQEIALKNFKLFDESGVVIRPGVVTVFIGPNGTGKSSILQALLLLKQSSGQRNLKLDGPLLNLGSFGDLVHRREVERPITIGLTAALETSDLADDLAGSPLASCATAAYSAEFDQMQLRSHRFTLGGDDEVLSGTWSAQGGGITPVPVPIPDGITAQFSQRPEVGQAVVVGGYSTEQALRTPRTYQALNALLSSIKRMLEAIYLIPATRGFDKISYQTLPSIGGVKDLISTTGPDEQARLTANVIGFEPDLIESVSERLSRILRRKLRLRSRLTQNSSTSVEAVSDVGGINLANEAFGLNQLVAPVLWLSRVPNGSIVGIEEPEIHLHPKAQADLCDVFVDVATQEKKQIILTTHSEHILMSLLTAVATGRMTPEELAVYEFNRQGSAATVERLEVNRYGQIKGGLKGFMEADLDEMGKLIEARLGGSK